MRTRTRICSFLLVLAVLNCSSPSGEKSKRDVSIKEEIFMDIALLERAGFEHIKPTFFRILLNDNYTYILNRKDSMLVRFNRDKPERVYKRYGQGPSEFLNPLSLFFYDLNTIAVFDNQKSKIFLFDADLNLNAEKNVTTSVRKISGSNKRITAFGDFKDGIFAIMDKDFKIVDAFGENRRKAPLKNLFPSFLYMGFLLSNGDFADTSWLHVYSKCKVDIIDPRTKKIKVSLIWKNPYTPTQKSFDRKENLYSSYYVGKHGKFYVVQNELAKNLKSNPSYDLLIFDEEGKLHITFDFNFPILKSESTHDNTKVYYMDDAGNIFYLDLETMK